MRRRAYSSPPSPTPTVTKLKKNIIILSGGSLGSRVDEERS